MSSISYLNQIVALAKRLLFLIILFSITRVLFFILNYSEFGGQSFFQILKSFIFGIRFDMSVIYYCNFLFILISLLPFKIIVGIRAQTILKSIFVFVNAILLSLNIIDIGYFPIIKIRSGWDMLSDLFSSDTTGLFGSYIIGYWYLIVIWLLLIFLLVKYYPIIKSNKIFEIPSILLKNTILAFISLLILCGGFGVARGLEGKPLRLISANDYVEAKFIPLLLNTPFSIVNTMGHKTFEKVEYMSYSEMEEIFTPIHHFQHEESFRGKNIIIIILESFGSEYIFDHKNNNRSYAPFLDSLIKSGLFCSNSITNSYNSRNALPAIIASMPIQRRIDYMGSLYSNNTLRALPIILKEMGYQTSFFHGGHNGTMSFDKFSKVTGMDQYFGYNEFVNYAGNIADDGGWGIFDEEFFQFMAHEVDEFKEPFFTTLFTLSSHDPYPIPEKYKNKFPKGDIPILESVAYTDFALQKLFNAIKEKAWYSNTLFVFVTDHTSLSSSPEYKTLKNKFSIPILFYSPSDSLLKGEFTGICQQIDIMPTILDYLKYDKKFVAYGKSIFSPEYRFAVNYFFNFNAIDSSTTLLFDGEKTNALYSYKSDPLYENNLYKGDELEYPLQRKLKAFIQDYEYRMVSNSMADTLPISKLLTQ